MNKDQLQQELLKKLKPGIKPSDLKKPQTQNSQFNQQNLATPPDSPVLKPQPEIKTLRDESHQKTPAETLINQLQQSVNYWSQTAQTYLTNLQTLEAELDQLQQTNQQYQQDIKQLLKDKEQLIKTQEPQPLQHNPLQPQLNLLEQENQTLKQQFKKLKQTNQTHSKQANFTCSQCQQALPQNLIRLIDQAQNKTCRDCLNKMLQKANQLSGEEIVLKRKSPTKLAQPFLCQTCQQSHPGEPHQVHVANYQEQGIIPQKLTSVCSPCLEERVTIANFYCPRTSEGKDTWDPQEPQFDCWCLEERREL